jgi:hypothetical protein
VCFAFVSDMVIVNDNGTNCGDILPQHPHSNNRIPKIEWLDVKSGGDTLLLLMFDANGFAIDFVFIHLYYLVFSSDIRLSIYSFKFVYTCMS